MIIINNIACFDIGGTFIKYGIINENGQILYKDKFSTPEVNCKDNIPAELVKKINVLKEKYVISSVGISTAGQVDHKKGEVIFAVNFSDYSGAKLSETIYEHTKLKCFVENDVNAAALGEMWMGAAKGKDTFLCITIGTGIGGAIVIDSKVYRGIGGNAGEVGHMTINKFGEKCSCGLNGCYDKYASTSALVRNYMDSLNNSGKTIKNINLIDGKEVISRANNGDNLAVEAYEDFLNDLTIGLVNLTHIFDPGLIVLGGGISGQGKPFIDEINKRFKLKVMKAYRSYTKIILAELQNDAGLLGACYLAK